MSSETLRKAYADIHAKYDVLQRQPKIREDIEEVTLNNPRLLLAEGFRQLNEQKDEE